jgi:hypothetical protein
MALPHFIQQIKWPSLLPRLQRLHLHFHSFVTHLSLVHLKWPTYVFEVEATDDGA